jgi:hypothetical protein
MKNEALAAEVRAPVTSAAKEAAEKRLKQVNSAFCATTIQQLTSDFWVKKRPKLLLWFIFQQPLKPSSEATLNAPLKRCSTGYFNSESDLKAS